MSHCPPIHDDQRSQQAVGNGSQDLPENDTYSLGREVPELENRTALRESQEQFQALVTASEQIVWITDSSGLAMEDSPSWRAFTGQNYQQYQGSGWLTAVHPEDREQTARLWKQPVSVATPRQTDYRLLHCSGEWRWMTARCVPLFHPNGTVRGWVGMNTDVTARKRAEQEDRERQLQTLADSIPQLVWMADAEGWIFWYNRRWYEYTGTTPEQMQGWGWQTVHHPEVLPGVLERWKESLAAGNPFEMELPLKGVDGEFRWFLTRIVPARNSSGAVSRWYATNTDVHTLRRAQDALQRSEARFRAAVQATSDLLWTNNPQGEMEGEQPGWAAFTGQAYAEYQGYGWSKAVHPEDAQPTIDEWNRSVAERRMFVFEHRVRRHDGVWRLCSIRALPVCEESGVIREWVGIHTDITEERCLLEQLRTSEQRLRLVTDNAKVGLVVVSREHRYLYANQAYADILSLPSSDIVGLRVAEVLAPVYEQIRPRLECAFAGETVTYELTVPPYGNRSERRYSVVYEPGTHTEGLPIVVVVIFEITERVRAEEALRRVSAELQRTMDTAGTGLTHCSRDLHYLSANPAYARLAGLPLQKIVGRPIVEVMGEQAFAVIRPYVERVLSGERVEYEAEVPFAVGGPRWLHSVYAPEENSQGQVLGWVASLSEITDRKRAEEAALASEARFRQLADAMPQIVWTARPDGDIDYYNERWYKLTGFDRSQPGDSSWEPVLHPDDAHAARQSWYQSVITGQPYQVQLRFWDRNALTYRWHLVRALAIRGTTDQIVKWFGTFTDIDDQKRTEEALRCSNQDLEQFAFAASHDLQEPLRVVATCTQMLARKYSGQLDSQADQFIRYAVEGAQRMGKLLDGLLRYSQAGNSSDSTATMDVGAVFQQALENLRVALDESGATITKGPLPAVQIPAVHVLELFQNMLGNAIRYRGEQPLRIHVSAHQDGAWIQFVIADNGIGIKPEYTHQIFGVFRRLHPNQHGEAGVGLAICKRLVERYGGRIWVESELGKGADFALRHLALIAPEAIHRSTAAVAGHTLTAPSQTLAPMRVPRHRTVAQPSKPVKLRDVASS